MAQNKNTNAAGNTVSSTSNPLPVIDICNNLITITGYIGAVENATLPDAVVSANPTLATQFSDWQESIWEQFFEGLLNSGIMAQAETINKLIQLGITEQNTFQNLVEQNGNPVPTVIGLCDEMISQINNGTTYVEQIQVIAQQLKNADQSQINQLQQIINTLNDQFNSLEDQLTEKAIDNSKEVVVTTIEVGVAVATDEDPISPLVKGIAQIGTDVINELILSDEINETLAQLETAWSAFDQETIQLAKITMILNQLNTITGDSSETATALNGIVNDWQTICDLIMLDSPTDWQQTGLPMLKEWAARMCQVQFYGQVSQQVSC